MMKQNKILAMAVSLIWMLQSVMAYEVRSGMAAFNLWDVFVGYVFGNFFLSVIGIAILLGLILIMGNISNITSGIFMITFLVAMALGYGLVLISIPLFALGVFLFGMQIVRIWGDQ